MMKKYNASCHLRLPVSDALVTYTLLVDLPGRFNLKVTVDVVSESRKRKR